MHRPALSRFALSAALCLCLGGLAAASTNTYTVMREDVRAMAAQIKNAKVKLQHVGGASAVGRWIERRGEAPAAIPAAQSCCTRNIESMNKRLNSLKIVVNSTYSEHKAENDREAMAAMAHVAEAFRDVTALYDTWRNTNNPNASMTVLKKLEEANVHLNRAIGRYGECCVPNASIQPN